MASMRSPPIAKALCLLIVHFANPGRLGICITCAHTVLPGSHVCDRARERRLRNASLHVAVGRWQTANFACLPGPPTRAAFAGPCFVRLMEEPLRAWQVDLLLPDLGGHERSRWHGELREMHVFELTCLVVHAWSITDLQLVPADTIPRIWCQSRPMPCLAIMHGGARRLCVKSLDRGYW